MCACVETAVVIISHRNPLWRGALAFCSIAVMKREDDDVACLRKENKAFDAPDLLGFCTFRTGFCSEKFYGYSPGFPSHTHTHKVKKKKRRAKVSGK